MGTNPATKYINEFRRETADYVISSGRPITECCRELGLNSKTVNRWVVARHRELAGNAIFHSDRGAQYTSRLLAGWADANGVRLSIGRTGSCHDNAVAESFFATLKNEMCSLRSWPTRAEARSAVVGFIEGYHNRARPHSTIGYQTPAGKMDAFFERTTPKTERVLLAA